MFAKKTTFAKMMRTTHPRHSRTATRLLGVESLERRMVLQGAPWAEIAAVGPLPDHAATNAGQPDQMVVVLGFSLEISGSDSDSAWETCSGGSLNIEISDSSSGGDSAVRGPLTQELGALGDEIARAIAKTTSDPDSDGDGVNEGSYEVLENGAGKFRIDIEGCPGATAHVESITIEDLVIDEREMTTGADWDYRVFGPGDAHYGSITLRATADETDVDEPTRRVSFDCSRGADALLKRDGSEARRFNFFESFPTRWDPGEYSPGRQISCAVEPLPDPVDDQDATGRGRNPQTGEEHPGRAVENGSPPSWVEDVVREGRRGRNPQTGKEIKIAAVANAPLPSHADEVVDFAFSKLGSGLE